MHKSIFAMGVLVLAAMTLVPAVHAQIPGAIFTTVADGSEVNFNIYANKEDVYLDGGPGVGAPQGAASLPDGVYVFMVTDPSGKVLLSTDNAGCRRFTVSAGIITSVTVAGACAHVTGNDVDHPPAITVQLMPYNDTPNHGNEYKVWVTPIVNYLCNADLNTVDCSPGKHGFVNRYSKTDNFKVGSGPIREIDTRFFDTTNGNAFIDGNGITWIDTHGASNNKWSYYAPELWVIHEAHVEAPENGTHQIVVPVQAGCTVIDHIHVQGKQLPNSGPQTVSVKILPSYKNVTIFVDVYCN